MSSLDEALRAELDRIRMAGLHRSLNPIDSPQGPIVNFNGKPLLNFSSNDYLGLANHPALKEGAIEAIQRCGAGTGASRLVCGSSGIHHQLEEALADFKRSPAALTFSSGYSTALGTICALLTKRDVILLDKLVHASIVDAARLSGATIRVFPHNNLEAFERLLQWADSRNSRPASNPRPRTLAVVESVYSMDGDRAPLPRMVELKDKYGAWLMVDEAHATGVLGPGGRGLGDETGVSDRIDIQMGTLGKALGAAGGFICGTSRLIEYLVNRARSFIFSTAPVPAAAGAALAAVQLVQSAEGSRRRESLWARVRQAASGLGHKEPASAILPMIIGDESAAVQISRRLRDEGFLIPAIRFPTVARGQARLRLTLTAAHDAGMVDRVVSALSGKH